MKNISAILKILLILFSNIILSISCKQNIHNQSKNKITIVIDSFCITEREEAIKDLSQNKLVYCNYEFFYRQRYKKEMAELLEKYGIDYKIAFASDVIIEGREDGCYCKYMQEQINKKFGKKFIDSLLYIADSIYISKNLDKVYDNSSWDHAPMFPGDSMIDPTNHIGGLQVEFEKLIDYPESYIYKADSISTAYIYLNIFVDEKGNAKIIESEFWFRNNKTKEENFNKEVQPEFKKIYTQLIEKSKWIPARIKCFNVRSNCVRYLELK